MQVFFFFPLKNQPWDKNVSILCAYFYPTECKHYKKKFFKWHVTDYNIDVLERWYCSLHNTLHIYRYYCWHSHILIHKQRTRACVFSSWQDMISARSCHRKTVSLRRLVIDLSFMELTQVNVELYIHTVLAAGAFIKVSGSAPIEPRL